MALNLFGWLDAATEKVDRSRRFPRSLPELTLAGGHLSSAVKFFPLRRAIINLPALMASHFFYDTDGECSDEKDT
ncbi:hypothetical protein I6G37_03545 [Serratia rubidaea]|nr:hypothetical protein I6G37_03545 [Serratia rubidaea]